MIVRLNMSARRADLAAPHGCAVACLRRQRRSSSGSSSSISITKGLPLTPARTLQAAAQGPVEGEKEPLHGMRVHYWVLLRVGKRQVRSASTPSLPIAYHIRGTQVEGKQAHRQTHRHVQTGRHTDTERRESLVADLRFCLLFFRVTSTGEPTVVSGASVGACLLHHRFAVPWRGERVVRLSPLPAAHCVGARAQAASIAAAAAIIPRAA